MKNLLLLLVLLSTVQAVRANELPSQEQTKQDIEECLNELELQHSDDKSISAIEYVAMKRECRRLGDLPKLILYKGSY